MVSVRESRGGHADRPPVLRVFTAGGRVVVVRVVAGGWLGPLAGWVCGDGLGQPWWVMVAASGTRWVAVPGQESFKRRALGWPASRSCAGGEDLGQVGQGFQTVAQLREAGHPRDRKSTRLNSSHRTISYAVFCLKKKKKVKWRS